MTTTVVFGPKTRLAAELVALPEAGTVVSIARDADDARTLVGLDRLAGTTILDASAEDFSSRLRDVADEDLRVVITALGPVHPDVPQTAADAARVSRDVDYVHKAISLGIPTQIVLISTVLALAPGDDRRYYGGWRGVIEQSIQQLAQDQARLGQPVSLSVLYPGRILDESARKGRRRAHTSYARLAARALRIAPGTRVNQLVGADSRIWLMVRCISLALRSLSPSTKRGAVLEPTPRHQ